MKNTFNIFKNKAEEFADLISDLAGNPIFLIAHVIWWGCWIGFKVEKYPFGMLTLIVSLEAICLSGLLLSSSNRESEKNRKIAQKDLKIGIETNLIVEELTELVKDLQSDLRYFADDEE